ncbi:MAG: DUF5990 family protein [Sandaracinaceae bacterium]
MSAETKRVLVVELAPMPDTGCFDVSLLTVGLQSGRSDVVHGESIPDGIRFEVTIDTKELPDGTHDFRGPLVHGKRGERFLYVTWGPPSGEPPRWYRRLKLYLGPLTRASWSQPGIDASMIRAARPLCVQVSGRGTDGSPACGTTQANWRLA